MDEPEPCLKLNIKMFKTVMLHFAWVDQRNSKVYISDITLCSGNYFIMWLGHYQNKALTVSYLRNYTKCIMKPMSARHTLHCGFEKLLHVAYI